MFRKTRVALGLNETMVTSHYPSNMKSLKTIAVFVIVALLQWSCGDSKLRQNEKIDNGANRKTNTGYYEKWFVYDQPINGYNVKIHWACDESQLFSGIGCFYFSNTDTTKMLTREVNIDGWFDEEQLMESLDTIVLNQYYAETMQPYLDWRTIVGFADYNFDGRKELVICGSPKPYRNLDSDDWLDCEDFTFYSDLPNGFVRINDEPFHRISTETCRTFCKFDTDNETLLLLTNGGACCSDSMTYYFRDGRLYKSIEVRNERLMDTTIRESVVRFYEASHEHRMGLF